MEGPTHGSAWSRTPGRRWARAMEPSLDALQLKRAVHNHKLQVTQEINTLKGILNHAESNHYALYNAHRFLEHCRAPARAILRSVCEYSSEQPQHPNPTSQPNIPTQHPNPTVLQEKCENALSLECECWHLAYQEKCENALTLV
jgi:hypothetical protein